MPRASSMRKLTVKAVTDGRKKASHGYDIVGNRLDTT